MQFSSFWRKYFYFWCAIDSKSSTYGKTHFKRNFTHNRARNHKHKELLVRSKVENTLLFIKKCPFNNIFSQLMIKQSLLVFFLYLKHPRIDAEIYFLSHKPTIFVDLKRRNELIWISLIHNVLRKDSRAIYGGSHSTHRWAHMAAILALDSGFTIKC